MSLTKKEIMAAHEQDRRTLARVVAFAERLERSVNWEGRPATIDRSFGYALRRVINREEDDPWLTTSTKQAHPETSPTAGA